MSKQTVAVPMVLNKYTSGGGDPEASFSVPEQYEALASPLAIGKEMHGRHFILFGPFDTGPEGQSILKALKN